MQEIITESNKKIHIYDNILSDIIIDKWKKFFEQDVSFKLSAIENENDPSGKTQVCFVSAISMKDRISVFEVDNWLPSVLANYNQECKLKHFTRSYLNLMIAGDILTGHVDEEHITSKFTENDFYVVCLIFLNPHVKEESQSGIYIEDQYIENKFNRLIVFNGTSWHKPVPPSDDLARLTLYMSFTNSTQRPRVRDMEKPAVKNYWTKMLKTNSV